MKVVAFTAMAAVAGASEAPQTSLALTWSDCGSVGGKITGVTPSTINLGTSTTITGSGHLDAAVSGGQFAATVKAGWIPLANCNGPLGPSKTCTLPLGAGSLTLNAISLPLQAGPLAVSMNVQLAASLPAQLASTTTHVTATSTSGSSTLCMDIDLKQTGSMIEEIPTSGGACSASDQTAINAAGGGDDDGHFPMMTEECGKAALNFFKGIDKDKFDTCLTGKVKISSACAGCYWQAAQYGFMNCKLACLASWCSSSCLNCVKPGGDAGTSCAGFQTTSVPVPCDAVNVAV